MKVLIFGATGLTGGHLTTQCLADNQINEVVIFVRKPLSLTHQKLKQVITDYDNLSKHIADFQGDVVFNCLGTTIKKAGSEAAQLVIDRDYPIQIAQLAATQHIPMMINVSSISASAQSNNFYLRAKGEMENGVSKAIGEGAYFLRPSFLLGKRTEFRLGERIGIYAMYLFDLFMIRKWSKYHSIAAQDVAKAMLHIAKSKGFSTKTLHYREIMACIK